MAEKLAYMPLYIADYLADTPHLSAAEHGAYLLLIMHLWRAGSLPKGDDQLARIARMKPREWKASRDTIAALFGDGWTHKRVEIEREKSLMKSNARAEYGARGGMAKSLKNNDVNLAKASALPEQKSSKILPSSSDTIIQKEMNYYSAREMADAVCAELPEMHPAKLDQLAEATCLGWIRSGFDIQSDILPAVRKAASSSRYRIKSLSGFTAWIEAHHADRLTAEQARPPPVIAAPSPSLISPRGSPHARQAPKSAAAVLADLRSGSGTGYRGPDPEPWAGPVLEHDAQPPQPSRVQ